MEEMKKRKNQLRDDILSQHNFFLVLVVALGFIIMDPFKMGPVGGHEFKPVRHEIAPYKEVMESWPRDNRSRLSHAKLEFVDEVFGPESLEFDRLGRGPYTGLADGRIVRWMGEDKGWETFALVTATWSEEVCAKGNQSTTFKQYRHEKRCGRPLGMRFNIETGELYIADAYHGLLVVGSEGGLASPLATHVNGEPILFANDLDIHKNGSVFFTDTSKRYNRVNHFLILLEGESTGRLLRYDPTTKQTHIVLDNLAFPNGVQLSKDHTFLVFAETTTCRLVKLWLEGEKGGTTELVANLPGFPDNVRINERGEFWVAIDCCRTWPQEILGRNPWIRSVYFRLPVPLNLLARWMGMKMYTVVSLISDKGQVLEVLEDTKGVVMKLMSEVREVDGKLWIGTVAHNHIATLPYPLRNCICPNGLNVFHEPENHILKTGSQFVQNWCLLRNLAEHIERVQSFRGALRSDVFSRWLANDLRHVVLVDAFVGIGVAAQTDVASETESGAVEIDGQSKECAY
ncbi:hypothetical protein V2J09_011362 [Rumex salicifolius]